MIEFDVLRPEILLEGTDDGMLGPSKKKMSTSPWPTFLKNCHVNFKYFIILNTNYHPHQPTNVLGRGSVKQLLGQKKNHLTNW